MPEPSWFVAVLVLQSRVGSWDDDPLVDHQVVLLRATDPNVAYRRAVQLGRDSQTQYENDDGEIVAWEFLGLSELDHLDPSELADGAEVFSWRSRGAGAQFVLPKQRLSVFADLPDAEKTARELLDE